MVMSVMLFMLLGILTHLAVLVAAPCHPLLSEGSHGELDVNGFTTLECDISKCDKVGKVVFEKQSIDRTRQWTPVFEGYNKTSYRALDTGYSYYSLKDRHEYVTLYSEHILVISPLTIQDQGGWRCAVYDTNMKRKESQPTKITLVSSCKPVLSEGSHSNLHLSGYTTFECDIDSCSDVSKIIFEKTFIDLAGNWTPVYEGISKTHYRALDTNISGYSLANRNNYATFHTRHVLYIEPLVLRDQGNWRCIVFDQYQRHMVSRETNLYLVSSCKPTISEHITNKLEMGGFTNIECSIKGCKTVSKIIFEKTFIDRPTEWISVYEGINDTYHKVLNTNITGYSLKDRNGYASFSRRHILYIEPLVPKDQGKWRCTVYDQYKRPIVSSAMEFNIGNKAKVRGSNQTIHNVPKCKPELSEGRDSKLEIHGYTFLECDFETCSDVYNITYMRKFDDSETWVAVFDGVNAPLHHKHGNNHAYSLTNRTHYAPFDTQHILSINPLLSDDEGDWRCVVHDTEGNLVMSQTMKIDLETKCNPEISEGLYSKREIAGHVSFECDTCGDLNKISFDKKSSDDQWNTVYVANITHHYATYASTNNYSIENRTRYVAFSTRHILYIQPLRFNDLGHWRCVTFRRKNIRAESNHIEVNIENPVKSIIKVVPKIRIVIQTHTLKYLCEIEHNYVEPPIVWMLNGTEIESEDDKVYQQDDPLYVKSVLTLTKEKARNSTIECKIKYKGKSGQWTWNSIAVDIEDGAKYDTSTQKSDIQITFIVFIIVLILVVIVLMIALCHLVQKLRKLETTGQHESACMPIMEDLDDADLRPGA